MSIKLSNLFFIIFMIYFASAFNLKRCSNKVQVNSTVETPVTPTPARQISTPTPVAPTKI